jgi:flagellar biosynthetic protein FliR
MPTMLELIPAELLPRLPAFFWTFARVGALLIAAPLFGARTVPARVRVMLALLIALAILPQVAVPTGIDVVSAQGALLLIREIVIGFALGFLVQMLFGAVAMAGEIIALSMGLAFASVVDPDRGLSVPVIGQYFVVLSTLLFLALNGHLALLTLLVDSFALLPPGILGLQAAGFAELAAWAMRMFEAAIMIALPAATALLVAGVSMGLIARSAPQLNIFAVGFPMTLMLGIVALLFSLPLLAPQFEQLLFGVLDTGRALLVSFR